MYVKFNVSVERIAYRKEIMFIIYDANKTCNSFNFI